MIYAFQDQDDGYYQIDLADGEPIPTWAENLIPCAVLPEPTAQIIPKAVTMRQARRVLLNAGLLSQVNTALSSITGSSGDAARIDWEFSSEVCRDWPLVLALAPVLGLTDLQLDQLFITAATL